MKRLTCDAAMQARINLAAGGEVDASKLAVFECVAMSGDPIKKPGSIFNGAVHTPSMLSAMAEYVNSGKSVPLNLMHDDSALPTGRVFYAQPMDGGLRAQFYMPADAPEADLIDQGVITEVSVSILSAQMLCSACAWDYLGEDAGVMNFIDQTCANDHTIGVDNTHLILNGLDQFFELSLVGTGASPSARILAPSAAKLSQNRIDRLAASGVSPAAVILTTQPPKRKEDPMADLNLKEFTETLASQAGAIAKLTVEKASFEATAAEVPTLKASLATATSTITDLEAKLAVTADYAAMHAYLTEQAQKALTASGKGGAPGKTFAELKAQIDESGVNLANLVAGISTVRATTLSASGDDSVSAFKMAKGE